MVPYFQEHPYNLDIPVAGYHLAIMTPLPGPSQMIASSGLTPPPRGRTGQARDRMALGREAAVKR